MRKLVVAAALLCAGAVGCAFAPHRNTVHWQTVTRDSRETIAITNLAPRYMSDAEIRRDIPAWEHAVNVDFARYWHTAHYKIVFLGRKPAPPGVISAVFVAKGPVVGALAYHTVSGNAPAIVVYSGTGAYYGFDNSVSFTHELFELAADPVTSYVNMGYPLDYVWLQQKDGSIKQSYSAALGWFSEVADPVEEDSYLVGKTRISDFVTPAWFGDGVGQRFDFLGLCQQPLWLRPGGYAQALTSQGWQVITNFRKGHPEDRGFFKGDRHDRS